MIYINGIDFVSRCCVFYWFCFKRIYILSVETMTTTITNMKWRMMLSKLCSAYSCCGQFTCRVCKLFTLLHADLFTTAKIQAIHWKLKTIDVNKWKKYYAWLWRKKIIKFKFIIFKRERFNFDKKFTVLLINGAMSRSFVNK